MRPLLDLLQKPRGQQSINQLHGLRLFQMGQEAEGAECVEAELFHFLRFRADEHAGDDLLAKTTFGAGDAGKDDANGLNELWRIGGKMGRAKLLLSLVGSPLLWLGGSLALPFALLRRFGRSAAAVV